MGTLEDQRLLVGTDDENVKGTGRSVRLAHDKLITALGRHWPKRSRTSGKTFSWRQGLTVRQETGSKKTEACSTRRPPPGLLSGSTGKLRPRRTKVRLGDTSALLERHCATGAAQGSRCSRS